MDVQRLAAFYSRMGDLDDRIACAHADGYHVERDRLLLERVDWARERDEILAAGNYHRDIVA